MHLCIQLDWFPKGGDVQESTMQVDWVKQYAADGEGGEQAATGNGEQASSGNGEQQDGAGAGGGSGGGAGGGSD